MRPISAIICTFFIGLSAAADSPIWGFECHNSKCVKVEVENKADAVSLPVCRLFCGDDPGTLWPKPRGSVKVGTSLYHFNINDILFEPVNFINQQKLWDENKVRFLDQIKTKIPRNFIIKDGGKKVVVEFDIKSDQLAFELDTDESYKLKISEVDGNVFVKITAPTYYGARHGLETLSQLIVFDDIRAEYQIVGDVEIEDSPAYKYRGLVLDTSRNYFSVESLKRTIDAMGMVKLNTFHWHITDSQSFPIILKSQPDLSQYGAYNPYQVYTEKDIAEVVDYARVRGVRVLPEFDAPAHVGEGWQKKGLTACFNYQPWIQYCVEPPCGQLDPSKDNLYNVLEDVYRDMYEMFQKPLIFHMGGDEVSVACWNSSTEIQDWMKTKGWQLEERDFMKLWGHFQENALARLDKVTDKKLPIILWTSRLTDVPYVDDYLNKDRYFIQIWTKGDDSKITDLLQRGFKLILSNYDALYFDCGFAGWVSDGNNWCSPYIGWQKVYGNDPVQIAGDKVSQILGAEAALWSEQADEYTLDSRFWPRASALAERLWSDPKDTWREAESRMLIHRERLVENRIAAESIQPQWCLQNEGQCATVL